MAASGKVRIGVLSTANIGLKKVIPGMQRGALTEITAIASRELAQAQKAASSLGIPKAYGSYEALLADPAIDAVYIPLPNDLHVPWAIKAAEAGKHVLCEKPVGMDTADVRKLIAARDRTGVKIAEAFMVVVHPQWVRTREAVEQGTIGTLRLVQGNFSYFNVKPDNIRNSVAAGGGALMDIGCYLIFFARFLFKKEPTRVLASIDRDPVFGVDRLTSMMLEFAGENGEGMSTFVGACSTQLVPAQQIVAFGTTGSVVVELPVNTLPNVETKIVVNGAMETFAAVDQYTLQGDAFARAILDDTEVPVPLEESLRIMAIVDALFRSAATNAWQAPTL